MLYYYKDGQRIEGAHKNIKGDYSNIYGDCTNIEGEVSSDLEGNISNIKGDITSIYGVIPEDFEGDVSIYKGDISKIKIKEENMKLDDFYKSVCDFNNIAGNRNDLISFKNQIKYLNEELRETQDAIDENNITEILDGVVDILYVTLGLFQKLENIGVDVYGALNKVSSDNLNKFPTCKDDALKTVDFYKDKFNEQVYLSYNTKFEKYVIKNKDLKVKKPYNYFKTDLKCYVGDKKLYKGLFITDLNGEVIIGVHEHLTGDYSNIYGDCTNIEGVVSHDLKGDVTGLTGDISNIYGTIHKDLKGNVSKLRGNVTGLSGSIPEYFKVDIYSLRGDVSDSYKTTRKDMISSYLKDKKEKQKIEMYDNINKPKHYMLFPDYNIEVRDLMLKLSEELDNKDFKGILISDYVQAMQYLLRWFNKNGVEDIKKALWYLNKIVESLESEDIKND